VVFGVSDPAAVERCETIVCCVNAREEVEIGGLSRFLSSQLPNWQIPRQWHFTPDLLANQRGKISRAEWRKRFLRPQP
jgi:acyl-CoA synthetase (AMP-forming)/AMP-acid ligase II